MSSIPKGSRIMALICVENDIAYFLGYGTYTKDEVPPEDPEGKRGLMKAVREIGHPNPKLELDDGRIIFGCECWWGDNIKKMEEMMKELVGVYYLHKYPESREHYQCTNCENELLEFINTIESEQRGTLPVFKCTECGVLI